MKIKEKTPTLEEQYLQVFKAEPQAPQPEEPSFEQPYFGRVVQTVTTYSVYEKPEQLLG